MKALPALQLACTPLPVVRIGLVGLGRRGMRTLARYADIVGAEVRAVADLSPQRVEAAQQLLAQTGRPAAIGLSGPTAWRELCQSAEVDVVYICTDWSSHCDMAVAAMIAGKHAAVEVPAATTVEECWRLVDTAEQTQRHLFMTENCCYDYFSLAVQEMADQGLLGDIVHAEGAYIHQLYQPTTGHSDPAAAAWMETMCARHAGNPYPTHGLGPIGWLLGLHRGTRMNQLVSMSGKSAQAAAASGHVNSSLISTSDGSSILLQFDVTTDRPYSRLQTVCGTQGFAQKYPLPTLKTALTPAILQGEAAEQEAARHMNSAAARCWKEGRARGVGNEMNYAMDRRFVHCLQNGLPLDIDVYDAAEWSCIAHLSRLSAERGSQPVAVPDFTRGRWHEVEGHHFYE